MLGPERADQEEGLLKTTSDGQGTEQREGWGEGRQKNAHLRRESRGIRVTTPKLELVKVKGRICKHIYVYRKSMKFSSIKKLSELYCCVAQI